MTSGPQTKAVALPGSTPAAFASAVISPTWPVQPEQQLVFLGLAAIATLVLVLRSRSTKRIGVAL